ncbi:tRNA (adenosine(37)-N6)-threonylcarbamoyltransferase complex ATPase subunit type 1 TsaE [Akkermansia glycaniphila]|uniref:tRNA threonylcarbamoyladenosine biosynthesis protein TsaE n=1 Tax=Akkermansia glycaniphila TaxID=1679444 RepID=A0A1H6KVP0_9BACT|nr:tRNA (adenosine(37)-N6)-threonylcarbamoyltransferase complex ATPase subunit type 1 TsaE [Akkermansia glycaniphila]SEH75749.1 t6a yjee: trna threonylcarbamoyl adenosine modification protein yjee [Akkermansia glycaniphila]
MENLHKIFNSGVRTVSSPEEMRGLGRLLAEVLQPGQVVGLVGDLGAGKTHLVQGILEGLGAGNPGVSPTFSLVHEHSDARIPVCHFDFYRMELPEELLAIGWDEYLERGDLILAEWANRFDGSMMPEGTVWLLLEHAAEGVRTVSLAV